MKLVDNISEACTWGTNQLAAALVILPPAWAMLTSAQQQAILDMLPFGLGTQVAGWQAVMALGAAIMVIRNTKLRG